MDYWKPHLEATHRWMKWVAQVGEYWPISRTVHMLLQDMSGLLLEENPEPIISEAWNLPYAIAIPKCGQNSFGGIWSRSSFTLDHCNPSEAKFFFLFTILCPVLMAVEVVESASFSFLIILLSPHQSLISKNQINLKSHNRTSAHVFSLLYSS